VVLQAAWQECHLFCALPPLKSCCTALLALGGATGGDMSELRDGEKVKGLATGEEPCRGCAAELASTIVAIKLLPTGAAV
jgi:hypothetical protein